MTASAYAKSARGNLVRRAVSMLELLTAMSVIAALFGLLAVALQQAREASRRTQCASNLRQVILGIDAFHAERRVLPPGRLFGSHGVGPSSTAWNWAALILPQIGEQAIFDAGRIPAASLSASGILNRPVSVYLCPSDRSSPGGVRHDTGNMVGIAVGAANYKAVSGANWGADHSLHLPVGVFVTRWVNRGTNGSFDGLDEGDGAMLRSDHRRPRGWAAFVDGVSNTFLLGEALGEYDAFCSWPYANGGYSTCAIPPNQFDAPRMDYANAQSFRSAHAGGLWMGRADGSVTFLADAVDLAVYRALATLDGGESIRPH